MSTPTRKATYQDVLDAPPHKVAEIVDGVLHLSPRPPVHQALAKSVLGRKLMQSFDDRRDPGDRKLMQSFDHSDPGDWWIIHELELHLGEDILVPDLAGWRRETLPHLPKADFLEIAPDWVCEVLSPSTRQWDLTGKRAIYAREGVSYLWFADPDARILEAFQLKDGLWSLIASLADDAPVSVPPFDAISFPLHGLWLDNPPAESDPEPGPGK